MGSLCDGADCFGIDTSLDGNGCLTNEVRCKDGVLTVISQGTILRRYAVGGDADWTDGGPEPVTEDVPTVNSGPRDSGGADKLTVTVHNPFCVSANVLINFEFAATLKAANTDLYSVGGEVALTGATFIEDNVQPFDTNNPQSAGPATYGPITAFGQAGVGVVDSGEVFEYTHAGAYTVMSRLTAGASFVFTGHARVDITAGGPLREIVDYNVAVTFLITAAL